MSLRARVVTLIAFVLVCSVLAGAALSAMLARDHLQDELASSLLGARQTVRAAFHDLPRSDHPARDLTQLIATFDGDRHVKARLVAADGKILATSSAPGGDRDPPTWFSAALGAQWRSIDVATPLALRTVSHIRLDQTPGADVAAAWRAFSSVVLLLAVFSLVGLALVYALLGAALRPLKTLSGEFGHIGAGDYRGPLAEQGPPELRSVQKAFNSMVSRLGAMTQRNQFLSDQLVTLQDEERAEIARDLHDEIGPHLFALTLDAQTIAQTAQSADNLELLRQARAIQSSAAHVQRQVRDLLMRLRPTAAAELGLRRALDDLLAFWRHRRPDMRLDLAFEVDETGVPPDVREVAYRVVQEALSNAVRHAGAGAIEVRLHLKDGGLMCDVADDGRSDAASGASAGFGLVGMRERVASSGGRLAFGPTAGQSGWRVCAYLPIQAEASGRPPGVRWR